MPRDSSTLLFCIFSVLHTCHLMPFCLALDSSTSENKFRTLGEMSSEHGPKSSSPKTPYGDSMLFQKLNTRKVYVARSSQVPKKLTSTSSSRHVTMPYDAQHWCLGNVINEELYWLHPTDGVTALPCIPFSSLFPVDMVAIYLLSTFELSPRDDRIEEWFERSYACRKQKTTTTTGYHNQPLASLTHRTQTARPHSARLAHWTPTTLEESVELTCQVRLRLKGLERRDRRMACLGASSRDPSKDGVCKGVMGLGRDECYNMLAKSTRWGRTEG